MTKSKSLYNTDQNWCLAYVLALAPGHIYWKNLQGVFLGCNDLQAIDAGLKCKEDIVGLTDYDMPWKENAEFIRNIDSRVISTGKAVVTEEKSQTFDGHQTIWLSRKEPLRDAQGKIIGIIGTSIDITDRKETERLKLEKIENLDSVLAVAPGHLYWKNLQGEYQGCNDLQAIDAGLKCKEDIVGLTDYDMPWKEDAEFLRKVDSRVISTGKAIVSEEKSQTFDGRQAIWLSRKEPLRDAQGKIIGIIGTSIDITAQKEAEQLKIENEIQNTKIKEHQKFINFIENIQHEIQSYKLALLANKANTQLSITEYDRKIELTKRQREIIYLLSLGKAPKEIASILSKMEAKPITSATITSIINKRLYPKFNSFNISQLIEKAHMLNLIPFMPESFK